MKLLERLRRWWKRAEHEDDQKMPELQEYDGVRLRRDLPQFGLAEGTEGTVVFDYGDGAAFEVEVVDRDGFTLFLGTLSADDLERIWRAGGTT